MATTLKSAHSKIKYTVYVSLLLGLIAFILLLVYHSTGDILAAVAAIGWGALGISLFRLGLLIFDTLSWQVLLHGDNRKSLVHLFWIRWIGDSVNTLLPVARIGGELVRARLLTRDGVSGALAGASVVVDMTAGVLTQFLFSVVGIAALMVSVQGITDLSLHLSLGLFLFGLGLLGFYLVQRSNPFLRLAQWMERLASGREWLGLIGSAAALDQAILDIYASRSDFILCCFWRIVGWLAGTLEVWLILYLLGHPISLLDAFVLESLGQAARSAGFMVPGGLGVQEGGLLLVGSQLGLSPELSLALSLVKRLRELITGIPGLIAWQIAEGRGIWLCKTQRSTQPVE